MKNKKSMEVSPMPLVIGAVMLSLVLLWVVFGLFPELTQKLFPNIKGQRELVTEDCDGDGVTGANDPCPCVSSIKSKQDLENKKTCGPSDKGKAPKNCPNYCKIA